MPDNPAPTPGRTFEVSLTLKDVNLRGSLMLPTGDLTLGEFAYLSNGLTDRVIGLAAKKDEADGHAISCRKGCAACCRQLVPISPPEAFMLADILDQQPPAIREPLLKKFEITVRKVEAAGYLDRLLSPPSSADGLRALSREYHALNLACPYLEDELCGIYPFRPATCRVYMVTTPAENCSKIKDRDVRAVPVPLKMSRSLAHVYAKMTGGEPEMVMLPTVLCWVLEHPEQRAGRYDAMTMLTHLMADINASEGVG